jgi:LL-diaminopimelate aminotransferase
VLGRLLRAASQTPPQNNTLLPPYAVSFNTLDTLISIRPKVLSETLAPILMNSRFTINPKIQQIGAFPFALFQESLAKKRANNLPILDFGVGDPREPVPEFIQTALCAAVNNTTSYPSVLGSDSLREAISEYLRRRFGCCISARSEILPTLGSKEAVYHTPFLLAGGAPTKKYVIYGVPGYFVMEKGAIVAGLTPYPIALNKQNNYLLDLTTVPTEILEKTAIVWLNYPHNPTGATCTLDYLANQYQLASAYNILFCSDETYVDIYYDTPPPSALQLGTRQGMLVYHSCSKRSGMTGYRSGFVAGDAELIETFARFRNTIGNAPPYFVQEAARAAWSDDEHSQKRRGQFKLKKALVASHLQGKGLEFDVPDGSFYLWVKAPNGLSGMEYAFQLLDKGIVVSPGDFFGETGSNFIRLSLSPTLNELGQLAVLW